MALSYKFNPFTGSFDQISEISLGTANGLSITSAQVLSLGLSSTSTTGALSSTDWNTFNNKQASGNYISALTGDVTATGPGSVSATIANNAVTDAKLRQSAALSVIGRSANSTGNVADIAAGTTGNVLVRSGTTLGFSAIDLSVVGTVGSSVLAISNGGTGQASKAAAFDALSPMTTSGDIIIGQGSGAGTRLAVGTNGYVLTVVAGVPAWQPAAGTVGVSEVFLTDGNGRGGTDTGVRRFLNTTINTGSDITYADSSTLGATFTINTTGRYCMTYSDIYIASGNGASITKNSTALTAAYPSVQSEKIGVTTSSAISGATMIAATSNLTSGDVIRCQSDSGFSSAGNQTIVTSFRITRVG